MFLGYQTSPLEVLGLKIKTGNLLLTSLRLIFVVIVVPGKVWDLEWSFSNLKVLTDNLGSCER